MENKGLYISKIEVNDLLHLKDFAIEVPQDNAPRHLFITGPNGTGKTILLKEIGNMLGEVTDEQNSKLNSIESKLADAHNEMERLEEDIEKKHRDIQQYKKDYNIESEKISYNRDKIREDIRKNREENSKAMTKLGEARNDIQKIEFEIREINEAIHSLHAKKTLESNNFREELENIKKQISKHEEDLKIYQRPPRFLFGNNVENTSLKALIASLKNSLSTKEDEYNAIESKYNGELDELVHKKQSIKEKMALAQRVKNLISHQLYVNDKEHQLLETKLSESENNDILMSLAGLIETNENIVNVISSTLEYKQQIIQLLEKERDLLKNKVEPICIYGVRSKDIINKYKKKQYLLSYYDDYRTNHFKEVERDLGKPNLDVCDIHTSKVDQFLKYLVDLKVQQSVALNKNEEKKVDDINKWFDNFTEILRELFDDKKLKLLYNDRNYEFKISSNKKKFGFTELSAGYNSALDIIVDLMLKMSSSGSELRSYEMPGIVLIDEVETHLHLALQRHIMPMLTKFFPKIQFIVTTHSPFVLNSIENAVAYDLVTREAINDLNEYSYSTLAEAYFGVNTESSYLTNQMDRFERLTSKAKLSASEKDEIEELREQLEKVPEWASPNIKTRFYELDSDYRTKVMQHD